jgi:aminoglycoside phosphotransferase
MPSATSIPRRFLRRLPDAWRALLAAVPAEQVTAGMSGARVFRLGTKPASYLKIADKEGAQILRREVEKTIWLAQQGIRVARLVRWHNGPDWVAVQTEALPGQAADRCETPQGNLLAAIGKAVARLHALPAATCPFDEGLTARHRRAREAVAKGEIDSSHFASRNRGTTTARLLSRLLAGSPPEDLVVAHGDLTLTNIIVGPDGAVGFVDCGFAGRADRYLDLAVLAAEIRDRFGTAAITEFANAYGMEHWDAEKEAYYADLYELF